MRQGAETTKKKVNNNVPTVTFVLVVFTTAGLRTLNKIRSSEDSAVQGNGYEAQIADTAEGRRRPRTALTEHFASLHGKMHPLATRIVLLF